MIISCPSCQAKFKVDDTKLGPAGRSVRCGKCGERWHQAPAAPEPEPEIEPAIEPAVEIEAAEARALFGMAGDDQAESAEPPDSLFEKLATPPPERPQPSAPASKSEPKPAPEAAPQDPTPEPTPKTTPETTPEAPLVAPPVRAEPRRPKVPKLPARDVAASPMVWASLVLALLVASLALVQGRDWVTQRVPGAERVYQRLGLGDRPSSGLSLREVSSERRLVDGADSLVIEGVIENSGPAALAVPSVEARLAGGETHQSAIQSETASLAPGALARFEITLPTPPDSGELSLHLRAAD